MYKAYQYALFSPTLLMKIPQHLRTGWHGMRIFRALIALWFVGAFFAGAHAMALFAAAFFGFQAYFDVGCGAGTCAPPPRLFNKHSSSQEEKASAEAIEIIE